MEEMVKNPPEVPTWERASRGETIDWRAFMSPWSSTVDFPAALYYRELMPTFPDAKVILTVRDASGWYESMGQTIVPALTRFPNSVIGPYLPYAGAPLRVMRETKLQRR